MSLICEKGLLMLAMLLSREKSIEKEGGVSRSILCSDS